jgi:glycosyltransferase involved in cell wall biosynthesis
MINSLKFMKIAFVNQPWSAVTPPALSSSIVIWTHEVVRRLVQVSDCKIVIYSKRSASQPRTEKGGSIEYCRVRNVWQGFVHRFLDKLSKTVGWQWRSFSSRIYYLPYILRIALDLRQQQCDVVHVHNLSQFVPVIRLFNPQIKIVLHMHCEWLTQLHAAQVEPRIQQADLVIGCSEFITNKIRQQFPDHAQRYRTVLNGVDPQKFSCRDRVTESETQNLLFVGRVSPEKGVHVLLQAFEQVVAAYPNARLTLVGEVGASPVEFTVGFSDDSIDRSLFPLYSRQYFTYLQQYLSPTIVDRVVFKGAIPHSNLMALYQEADVFVYPSVWNEPFGIPIVEAMAAEIPVVSTRSGGIVEIIDDGKTGLLAQRNHASELASAVLRLLADTELRVSMAKAGRKRVLEQFTWDQIAQDLLHHYQQLCEPEQDLIVHHRSLVVDRQ